jgi:hypothetical protein
LVKFAANDSAMRKVKVVFIFMVLGSFLQTFSQQRTTLNPDHFFDEKREVYFRIPIQSINDIEKLANIVSIDRITSTDWVYAYANKKEFSAFLKLELNFEILENPGTLHYPLMKSKVDLRKVKTWDFYPTYDAYIEVMYQFEELYPDLCDVFSIGKSAEARDLLFAKITGNNTREEEKPCFLYTATIHGDETAGYVLMLHLIDFLLGNYGSNDKVTHLVDNLEIWINPLANPDGTYAGGNNSVYGATRGNANGIDLNRNYPDPQDGPHPDGNEWQTETIEFIALADSISFVMGANFHGGTEVFNYPWDTWPQLHADDDWWQYVGREWADSAQYYSPDGYFTDLNNGITNGYAWYTVNGGRQDYMNYFHQCREVTLEISNTKLLPESYLEPFWEYNYRSFLNYMEQALFGVSGIVTDSTTGQPLKATVFIANHDMDNSWVVSDSLNGRYFRLLYGGTYDITFSAAGYLSKTIENVQVENRQATILNVELVAENAGVSEQLFSAFFDVGPNPVSDRLILGYKGQEPIKCCIELIDSKGKLYFIGGYFFSPGQTSYKISMNKQPVGIYLLKITSSQFSLSQKLIKK